MGALVDYRFPGDLTIFHALNGLPAPLARAITLASERTFGLSCLAVALAVVAWHTRPRWLPGVLAVGGAVATTDLLGARILKPLCHRLRPCEVLPLASFHPWLHASNSGSMPSLHSADAFAAAVAVSLLVPRGWMWAGPLATLIALSRPVGGVHWPSDIVAGALLGGLVGAGCAVLARRWRERRI